MEFTFKSKFNLEEVIDRALTIIENKEWENGK